MTGSWLKPPANSGNQYLATYMLPRAQNFTSVLSGTLLTLKESNLWAVSLGFRWLSDLRVPGGQTQGTDYVSLCVLGGVLAPLVVPSQPAAPPSRAPQAASMRRRFPAGGAGSLLDIVTDWGSELSLGEQQRLAFARVLLSRPRFVLMDESTSALDQVNQDHLYQVRRAPFCPPTPCGERRLPRLSHCSLELSS